MSTLNETHKVCVLSTAHLTADAVKLLEQDPCILSANAQIMVYCGQDEPEYYGQCLCGCIDFVKTRDSAVSYILFDRDADTEFALKTYDW